MSPKPKSVLTSDLFFCEENTRSILQIRFHLKTSDKASKNGFFLLKMTHKGVCVHVCVSETCM